MLYIINYGFGVAKLYTPCEDWKSRFYELANQCFGIRKSILYACLIGKSAEKPCDPFPDEYERLEHGGDVIVWNEAGEKIKSEWDFRGGATHEISRKTSLGLCERVFRFDR